MVAQQPQAYSLSLNTLQQLLPVRFLTGNRVGVPSRLAAAKIAAEGSRVGQLSPDFRQSLLALHDFYVAADKDEADLQQLDARNKRKLWGFAFNVGFSPLNVMLTNEAALRIYAKQCREEPGLWADYTGGICRSVGLYVFALPLTRFAHSGDCRLTRCNPASRRRCCTSCWCCRLRPRDHRSRFSRSSPAMNAHCTSKHSWPTSTNYSLKCSFTANAFARAA